MATDVMDCPLCGSPSLNFRLYVSHLRLVHAKDQCFNIMCGVDACREVFRTFSAFNSHVYRHHRNRFGTGVDDSVATAAEQRPAPSLVMPMEAFLSDTEQHCALAGDSDDELGSSPVVEKPDTNCQYLQAVTSAKFLLKLREGHQVSQVAIADVTTGCKTLCKQAVDMLKQGIETSLAKAGINIESIPGLTDVLNCDPDPFVCVDTNYRFEKFCVENLGCLVSHVHTYMYTCMHACTHTRSCTHNFILLGVYVIWARVCACMHSSEINTLLIGIACMVSN